MIDPGKLVIFLGASTRAAAASARRAGWTPWCADLFADADLRRIASVRKIADASYPRGLLAALADAPHAPVIYTGALENRPDLIARLDRPVWGNPPEVLRAVRSPNRWTEGLQRSHIPCPAITHTAMASGRWLLKPRRSAGGMGLQPYSGQAFNPRTHFLQEWIEGVPCSALFLGCKDSSAVLLGVTQQLVGVPWLNATEFHYAGNVGPLAIDGATIARWQVLGATLSQLFSLRGLFGVDAILRDGVPWPIEINPRYTASVEVLERCHRQPLLPLHRAVFEDCFIPNPSPTESASPICGKAILYARRTFCFPVDGPWLADLCEGVDLDATEFADIPHPGEIIEQGRPVLTLFASAPTLAECLAKLQEKAQALDRRLWP